MLYGNWIGALCTMRDSRLCGCVVFCSTASLSPTRDYWRRTCTSKCVDVDSFVCCARKCNRTSQIAQRKSTLETTQRPQKVRECVCQFVCSGQLNAMQTQTCTHNRTRSAHADVNFFCFCLLVWLICSRAPGRPTGECFIYALELVTTTFDWQTVRHPCCAAAAVVQNSRPVCLCSCVRV